MSEAIALDSSNVRAAGTPRVFAWVWLSQLFSVTGSALTGFGLGVWTYQHTGSVLDYSLLVACAAAPALMVAPWAGAWIDRVDRRWIMILGQSGAALCTGTIGLLLWSGRLDIWQILLLYALAAICQTVQRPAFLAAVTTFFPKGALGRASGLTQLVYAFPSLIAPLLSAYLLGAIGLAGIIALNLACFAVAMGLLLSVKFPRPIARTRPLGARRSALHEFSDALTYIRQRQALRLLMGYIALEKFLIGIVIVLLTPFVLAAYSAAVLGTIMTFGGVGMIAGSLLMSRWGGPRRRVLGILASDMLLGAAVVVGGTWTSIPMICMCTFVVMLCRPVIAGCDQTLWQHKTPPDLQGRVFALRDFIINAAFPLAAVATGLVAENYFKHWMMAGGLLADSAGVWLGVGEGRGAALMFVAAGTLLVALAGAAMLHPAVRGLDENVPDAH